MRIKLVVIGVFLILLSTIIFAVMIMEEEKVVEKKVMSQREGFMDFAKSLAHPEPEPIPFQDYALPGFAVLLLIGGICFLVNAKNEKFLPWIH